MTSPARGQRGHALAVVLFLAFVTAVLVAALARLWYLDQQRDKERELLWIGRQFTLALGRYAATTPQGHLPRPQTLEDLLSDKRIDPPQRHLRRLYLDPMTQSTDWAVVRAADGTIAAVHSKSAARPLKKDRLWPAATAFEGAKSYSEWRFEAPIWAVRNL